MGWARSRTTTERQRAQKGKARISTRVLNLRENPQLDRVSISSSLRRSLHACQGHFKNCHGRCSATGSCCSSTSPLPGVLLFTGAGYCPSETHPAWDRAGGTATLLPRDRRHRGNVDDAPTQRRDPRDSTSSTKA